MNVSGHGDLSVLIGMDAKDVMYCKLLCRYKPAEGRSHGHTLIRRLAVSEGSFRPSSGAARVTACARRTFLRVRRSI